MTTHKGQVGQPTSNGGHFASKTRHEPAPLDVTPGSRTPVSDLPVEPTIRDGLSGEQAIERDRLRAMNSADVRMFIGNHIDIEDQRYYLDDDDLDDAARRMANTFHARNIIRHTAPDKRATAYAERVAALSVGLQRRRESVGKTFTDEHGAYEYRTDHEGLANLHDRLYLDCTTCQTQKTQPGGPPHHSSPGHKNHCTCESCF